MAGHGSVPFSEHAEAAEHAATFSGLESGAVG